MTRKEKKAIRLSERIISDLLDKSVVNLKKMTIAKYGNNNIVLGINSEWEQEINFQMNCIRDNIKNDGQL